MCGLFTMYGPLFTKLSSALLTCSDYSALGGQYQSLCAVFAAHHQLQLSGLSVATWSIYVRFPPAVSLGEQSRGYEMP